MLKLAQEDPKAIHNPGPQSPPLVGLESRLSWRGKKRPPITLVVVSLIF